jgi:putative nucleotidyltransferase with HDIG domain
VGTLPPAAAGYWLGVVGAGAVVLAAAGSQLRVSGGWDRFAVLAAAASFAQLSAVQLTRNRVFHPAIVFVVAGAVLLTPQQLVLMCVVQHVPDWLKHRYAWYIQPFNIADYTLAAGAAALTAKGLEHVALAPGARLATAGIAAAGAFVAVNRLLLVVMLRLGRGLSTRETGLLAADDVGLEYVLALMAVPFAALWSYSVTLSALSLAPLVLIHVTQRAQRGLEFAAVTIQEQNDKLAAASELVIERSTAALEALSATVDARDAYTAGHSRRVREVAVAIGDELGLSPEELETLSQAALLHDIGKIAVPDAVLLKDGPLDQSEWLVMRSHSEEGARIIERLGYLGDVVPAIRHHHERMDGRGYPYGLHGDDIPVAARIIHVADAIDAMLTRRLYRDAMTFEEALAQLRDGRGSDFCERCIDVFERLLAEGPSGSLLSILGLAGR